MFMSDSKKKASTMILGAMSPATSAKAAPSVDGAEQDSSIGLESAAEDILSAIDSKDAKALATAMQSMFEMCSDEESDTSPAEQNEEAAE